TIPAPSAAPIPSEMRGSAGFTNGYNRSRLATVEDFFGLGSFKESETCCDTGVSFLELVVRLGKACTIREWRCFEDRVATQLHNIQPCCRFRAAFYPRPSFDYSASAVSQLRDLVKEVA